MIPIAPFMLALMATSCLIACDMRSSSADKGQANSSDLTAKQTPPSSGAGRPCADIKIESGNFTRFQWEGAKNVLPERDQNSLILVTLEEPADSYTAMNPLKGAGSGDPDLVVEPAKGANLERLSQVTKASLHVLALHNDGSADDDVTHDGTPSFKLDSYTRLDLEQLSYKASSTSDCGFEWPAESKGVLASHAIEALNADTNLVYEGDGRWKLRNIPFFYSVP